MEQLQAWLGKPGHTVAKLAQALGISRQAIYNGLDSESWGRKTVAGISAVTGIEMPFREDAEIEEYARECLERWRSISS